LLGCATFVSWQGINEQRQEQGAHFIIIGGRSIGYMVYQSRNARCKMQQPTHGCDKEEEQEEGYIRGVVVNTSSSTTTHKEERRFLTSLLASGPRTSCD
jgi:D-arabinose 1-dehydrogenase-like Zn-dependent alcohol dehydrogenase